jgi:hypothetical protein
VTKVACHAGEGTIGPGPSEIRPCNDALPGADTCYVSMSEHPSYRGRLSRAATAAAERPATSEPATASANTRRYSVRACCCPAPPAVIAVMPARGARHAATDLLLCGHHYRASKVSLAAAGATILDMTGCELAGGDWPGDCR